MPQFRHCTQKQSVLTRQSATVQGRTTFIVGLVDLDEPAREGRAMEPIAANHEACKSIRCVYFVC